MRVKVQYPDAVWQIRDVRAAVEAGDAVGELLEKHIEELDADLTIKNAGAAGLARREKILGIAPADTASLEDRRLEVLLRWYDTPLYTERTLRQRLDAALGEENYTLLVDLKEKCITCRIELIRRLMQRSVQELLEQMVPLDYRFTVELRYNQYKDLKKYTYRQLKEKTWRQLRNEVIKIAGNSELRLS